MPRGRVSNAKSPTRKPKARSYGHRKMSLQTRAAIKQLKSHERFIREAHKKGELDEEKFNIPEELDHISGRIKNFFRRHRDRG